MVQAYDQPAHQARRLDISGRLLGTNGRHARTGHILNALDRAVEKIRAAISFRITYTFNKHAFLSEVTNESHITAIMSEKKADFTRDHYKKRMIVTGASSDVRAYFNPLFADIHV